MAKLDAITLSVIQASLQQVCDEMDLTFSRAAFSPVIAEANDRSDGIYSAEDGSLIAQGAGGLPVFVGVMQYSTKTLIKMIADGRCLPPEPGDIYIVNDPYLGGTHLMDVRFVMPVYRRGAIFCWLSNTGHWPDIGGAVPGGRAGGASAAPGQTVQEDHARPRNIRHHLLQHPRCRSADRGHQGTSGRAHGRAGQAL